MYQPASSLRARIFHAGIICLALSSVALMAQDPEPDVPAESGIMNLDDTLEFSPPGIPEPGEAPEPETMNGLQSSRDLMYEAMVNVQDELFEEAIPKLERVIEREPTLLGAWETLGWAYWQTGDEEKAVSLWEQLVEIAPNEPQGYNLLAQVATRELRFEEAVDLYQKSLELEPVQFEIRKNLAQVHLWNGDWEKAIALLRQLLDEDPQRLDVEIDLAWSLFGYEDYEQSLYHWNRIIEIIPDNPGFLLARANLHLLLGMFDKAVSDANAVLELDQTNLAAMNILISLAVRQDRPFQTVERLDELLELTEGFENKVRIAQRKSIYMNTIYNQTPTIFTRDEVVAAARDAWELDENNIESAMFYAEQLVQAQLFIRAGDVADFILEELNPNNERAKWVKFETYMGRNLLDDAEQQLMENLRSFNPENPFRHVYWSRIHFARGDFQLSLKALERLEREGARGAVFGLLYHGVSPSEFSTMPSVREVREQVMALKRDGFIFMTPNDLPEYFDSKTEPPPAESDRPWLNSMVEGVKYSWTGEAEDEPKLLRDYSPEMRVMVTFDDGLSSSFRYGSQIAEEVGAVFTMFVGVGDVMKKGQRFVANFSEIVDYVASGHWEIQSHLWDAGQLFKLEPGEEGRRGLPLPNRLWLEDMERMETLREYQLRLRKEFEESRMVLSRELNLPLEEINSVAYPYGEVGQENITNIEMFDVSKVILNEADIFYQRGFIQYRFGYSVKGDNPLLFKRYEPPLGSTGRDVLREAYRQHPVFAARHLRVEIAAMQGRYDMAMENIELLRRDGYPEEDLRELTEYVDRNLARLIRLPDAVEDTATQEERMESTSWIQTQDPYIGVDGRSVRANDIIDEQEIGIFAGLNLTRKVGIQARYGEGEIEQSFNTGTNRVFEVFQSVTGSNSRRVDRIVEGQRIRATETTSFTESLSFGSNTVDRLQFEAEFERTEGQISYIHDSGAFTIARVGLFELFLIDRRRKDDEVIYGIEHQWRPFPNLDFIASFNHGVVPSARQLISYDQVVFSPTWRIRDWWQASGTGAFSFYNDDNSFVNTEIENLMLLSERLDVWWGLHNSITTTDEESELYWSPYWEQRHFLILEIRRNYPRFSAAFRGHLGFQKERARDEDIQEFLNLVQVAEEQGGFSAGEPPDEGWNKLLGFSAELSRTWENGFEVNASFLVNATNEYIEHNVIGSLLYRF